MPIHSMTDLTNASQCIPIGNQLIQVQRMSISEIWILAEKGVTDTKFAEAAQLSEKMKLTSNERISFMRDIMRDMPKGTALQEAAQNWLGTPVGIAAVIVASAKKVNPALKESEVAEILRQGTSDQLVVLASWCVGSDGKIEEKKEEEKKTEDPKA